MVDADNLKAICARLEALLSDDDAKAVAMLEANASLLGAAFPSHYSVIEHCIQSFDFGAALEALRGASEIHAQKESR